MYSWFGNNEQSIFAHPKQKYKNKRCYNAKPLLNHSRKKIITRYRKWNEINFLETLWNVQLFSPIGQALSNKCEAHHSLWKKRFYHWFRTQSSIDNWYDFQIVILANTCLSRIDTLKNNQNNSFYKDIDWEWINKMDKVLIELFDMTEIKLLLNETTNGHIILDLDNISINDSWFKQFDPSQTYKRIPRLTRQGEDDIIAAVAMIISKKKRKDDDMDTINRNKTNDVVITPELLQNIHQITGKKYDIKHIETFLLKIFKNIEEADADEEDQMSNIL